MGNEILREAAKKIHRFNEMKLHYNLVADQIYKRRFAVVSDPFDRYFLPYIIAGLISFDIGRMMGDKPYVVADDSFGARLSGKLEDLRSTLKPLMKVGLAETNLQSHHDAIMEAYRVLSAKGAGGLHTDETKSFHVGATKVLHFLNPSLFIIVDSNASRAFKVAHEVGFINTTQPGYSAERYLECIEHARDDMRSYGLDRFQALEPDTPITRIYDKLTFMTGYDLGRK